MEEKVIEKRNKGNKLFEGILIGILLITIGACGCYFVIQALPGTTIVNKSEKEVTVNENGIADAVEKVYDSVVIVNVYKNQKMYGSGSGFIFKKDGNKYYIMTNNHVAENADSIKVILSDDNSYDVKLVGMDKYLDIAVLLFESDKDHAISEIGSSTNARVGDTVFTVGAPIDSSVYSWTVTRGILSGKDRKVSVSTSSNSNIADYIRTALTTDAVINSGNSGGPLCNSNGEVIGITNMKLVSTGIEGMSFAIPIEEAMQYANKLINGEDVSRPAVGITMSDIGNSAYLYYYYGIRLPENVTSGVIVTSVVKNSPAQKAGIEAGDIITEVNGTKVSSMAEFKYELYKYKPGDKIKIKINRDGTEKELEVTLTKSSQQ